MPGKSRRGRGKHSARSKKRQSGSSIGLQQRVATEKPAATATPAPGRPTPITAPAAARYSYITTELRRIGILAGIMLAILVVLALVLP